MRPARSPDESPDARAAERARLRAWLRSVVVAGLEELAAPEVDPAALVAAADGHATRLRAELEASLPPGDADDAHGPLRTVREEEREWVRGHLHDTALQILEFIAGDGFGTGLTAKHIANLAGGAAHDLRAWLDRSEPPADAQLLTELELVAEEARALRAEVELEVAATPAACAAEHVAALAGAVREALTNARKHSRASRIIVRVEVCDEGRTTVTVTDNGIGIDLEQAMDATGLGLRSSIRGRMERVGGSASLQPAPGGGTRVTLVAPTQPTV